MAPLHSQHRCSQVRERVTETCPFSGLLRTGLLVPDAHRPWGGAQPWAGEQEEEEDLGELLLCVSDLGSPGEDGGCEVASPNGPCHSWHACHRYIGPKFKCLQKVKM